MENHHLEWIFPLKIVIVHSYVKEPEGIGASGFFASICVQALMTSTALHAKFLERPWVRGPKGGEEAPATEDGWKIHCFVHH